MSQHGYMSHTAPPPPLSHQTLNSNFEISQSGGTVLVPTIIIYSFHHLLFIYLITVKKPSVLGLFHTDGSTRCEY